MSWNYRRSKYQAEHEKNTLMMPSVIIPTAHNRAAAEGLFLWVQILLNSVMSNIASLRECWMQSEATRAASSSKILSLNHEPRTWVLSLDFFCAFPAEAKPGIQLCSFSMSICPKVSSWRHQIILPVKLSPWWTPNITLGQKISWPSQGLCFYLRCFQGPNLQTTFCLSPPNFYLKYMRVPEYSYFFPFLFFSIPVTVRILSLGFEILGGEKTNQQKVSHTFLWFCLSLICKNAFFQPLTRIKLNLKVNIKPLFRT